MFLQSDQTTATDFLLFIHLSHDKISSDPEMPQLQSGALRKSLLTVETHFPCPENTFLVGADVWMKEDKFQLTG